MPLLHACFVLSMLCVACPSGLTLSVYSVCMLHAAPSLVGAWAVPLGCTGLDWALAPSCGPCCLLSAVCCGPPWCVVSVSIVAGLG